MSGEDVFDVEAVDVSQEAREISVAEAGTAPANRRI